MGDFINVLAIAAAAGLASPLGGYLAFVFKPHSLMLSVAVGFAGGVLLGTFAFEMMPEAISRLPIALVVICFIIGFGAIYVFDLYVNRGEVAGPEAEERRQVERYHKRRKPRGTVVTIVGGATSAEEIIEGIVLGAGAAVSTGTALVIGLALLIDNISEALSIGALAQAEEENAKKSVMIWTSAIGGALFVSAIVGWLVLRGLPQWALGALLAMGAGAMFNLTISDLLPEAESRQFQRSSSVATGVGFLVSMVLAHLQ